MNWQMKRPYEDETVIPVFENNSGVPEIIELISYK